MDIRNVETMPTAGSLSDTAFAIDPNKENISLNYDPTQQDLMLMDTNLNYSVLPWQLGVDLKKKVILTYNGVSCQSGELIQTVVMESDDSASSTQAVGYNNSNGWLYKPANFNLPGPYPTTSDPLDTNNWPYDQSQGITVVKQFLTAQGNPGQFKAYYRAPVMHSFELANAEGTKIYTDGWYTSYTIAAKTWNAMNLDSITTAVAKGTIVHYPIQNKFYINLTGTHAAVIPDPNNVTITIPDTTNWRENPTFPEWMDFLRNNMGPAMTSDPVYFTEQQHLVTADLNKAIKAELLKIGCCCDKKDFGMSTIETWMKLTQKRFGAYVKFNEENFKIAQQIIETTRATCYLCLYHDNEKLC